MGGAQAAEPRRDVARARRAHLSSRASFLRRCRRLLPVSAAGSALWNHHTSPARCCSASAAALCSRSSAARLGRPDPTSRRYALPPSRTPASPSSPRRPPPSPPRRRRRRHRRRRLLFRAPLVFIESKQASWRRPPSPSHPSQRAPRSPPPLQHPGSPLADAAGRDHPASGGGGDPSTFPRVSEQ